MKNAIAFAVVLVIGLCLGWAGRGWLGSNELPNQDAGADPAGSAETPPAPAKEDAAVWKPLPLAAWQNKVPAELFAELKQNQDRAAALEKENEALREKLHMTTEEMRQDQGDPINSPEQLDARFAKDALMKSLREALEQAGFKGEVTDVDCSEYPCLVSGTIDGETSAESAKKILEAQALGPYQSDKRLVSISGTIKTDEAGNKRPVSYFGVAFYPKEDERGQEILKRFHYRWQKLREALEGQ